MQSETFKPLHFLLALLGLLLCTNCPLRVDAILCRTGVDLLGGPAAECGPGHQCLNTTSALGQTVYSCDFGGICESILNLREGCVRDGQRMVGAFDWILPLIPPLSGLLLCQLGWLQLWPGRSSPQGGESVAALGRPQPFGIEVIASLAFPQEVGRCRKQFLMAVFS